MQVRFAGNGNFLELPTAYRDPYEYSHPDHDEDYLPQFRPEPRRPRVVPAEAPAAQPA